MKWFGWIGFGSRRKQTEYTYNKEKRVKGAWMKVK
jgi:hypothetical protein